MQKKSLRGLACLVLGLAAALFAATAQPAPAPPTTAAAETFTLWQLPNQSRTQMMSYVVRTVHGQLIVIDGGTQSDAAYLKAFIKERGGNVEAWLITHVHNDHVDALGHILAEPEGVAIKAIYGSIPDPEWVAQHGDDGEKKEYAHFRADLEGAMRKVEELELGQELAIDGVRVEILGVKNPEITVNAINNSSVVMRFSDARKSVLFTADLGAEGGQKLLASPYADRLPSDYVQMAHHGQNGVAEAFYAKVNPSYCLWPTPKWLWENDNGGGPGSGRWRTLEVRGWMEKRAIKKHFLLWEGLQQID